MSMRIRLTPPAKFVNLILLFDLLSPQSVIFPGKPLLPLGLESFIQFLELPNTKAILMFRVANII